MKSLASAKFDETVNVAVNLGVDPRHGDQMVRGVTTLPHGTGKSRKVLVFAKGQKAADAEAAGADLVGAEELIEQVQKGQLDWKQYDLILATPGHDGPGRPSGRDLQAEDAEPEGRNRLAEHRPGRQRHQEGDPRRVPRREGRHRPCAARQSVVYRASSFRRTSTPCWTRLQKAKPSVVQGPLLQEDRLSTTMGPSVRIDPLRAVAIATGKG